MKELPESWEWKKLGEVATYINGRAFKPSEWESSGRPIIRIQNLNKADANCNYTTIEFEEKYKVEYGDLLYAWSASLGVYIWKGTPAWLNQHIFKVVPKANCDKLFLFYCLEKVTAELYTKTHGSGMVHVTKGKFEETVIPLPPLPVQHAIVTKIEEIFSELDHVVEQLKTARQQLKVYKQAVLKWAFEGRLTNAEVKDGELPEGWKEIRLGDVIIDIEAGKSIKCDERPPKENEIGIVKVSAVTWGTYDEIESKTCYSVDAYNPDYLIREGDFLFSRANTLELVGACVIVQRVSKQLMLSDKILRFHFSDGILKPFILYYLRSQKGRHEIEQKSSGNQMSMRNIGQGRIREIELPLPPLSEQHLIVSEIERRLSVCDKLEETIEGSLKAAEVLRAGVLKRAFEGRLVP